MRYSVRNTKRFDKDLIKCAKRGLPMKVIYDAIKILTETGSLPTEYKPHKLTGNYAGKWECHIKCISSCFAVFKGYVADFIAFFGGTEAYGYMILTGRI